MTRDKIPKQRGGDNPLASFFESVTRFVFWVSLAATVLTSALLVYYFMAFGAGSVPVPAAQASATVAAVGRILLPSAVFLVLSAAFYFWAEEVLGPLMLMGAAALYFAPLWLPLIASAGSNPAQGESAGSLQTGGMILGVGGLLLTILDAISRINLRTRYGSKSDLLKYGKNVKTDDDRQNVFLGKCWQLPFCRKFVRDKCPIYHAKRTCWKERVGCMCEETVIANAMQGKVIPSDVLMAQKYIPRNTKISAAAKAERCKQCIIYNEHQKQKYKLALPATLIAMGAIYFGMHGLLLDGIHSLILQIDRVVGIATFRQVGSGARDIDKSGMFYFQELLLFCLTLVVLAYIMRVIEYVFFKLKI